MEMANRFKGLDLIEYLKSYRWRLYSNDENYPQEKEIKKAKWLSEKALQTATKRREAKGKREKERYTLPNAKFQRTARRDKKAVLSQ